MTPHNVEDVKRIIDGRTIVCSVSGGKDSTAMSLYITRELGLDARFVFANTYWEAPETLEYIRDYLPSVLGAIDEVEWPAPEGSPRGMIGLIQKKRMFPSRVRRYCTEELKVKPLARYIKSIGGPTVNAVGIRAAESQSRSKSPEWEPADDIYGSDCLVWRPLIKWTEQDVIDIHTRHGIRPNPLYLGMGRPVKGADSPRPYASRVGCLPCIFSRKAEVRAVAEAYPEQIDIIRGLERDLTEAAGAPRGFFQSQSKSEDGVYHPVTIDDVVAWSRTSFGGKQVELFYNQQDAGCARWGLCEAAPDEESSDE